MRIACVLAIVAASVVAGASVVRSGAEPGCAPASSAQFTGARFDAPFFVFDGGSRGNGLGQFDAPATVAYVGAGRVAIVDTGNARVKIDTTEGHFHDFIGGRGGAPGRLDDPRGVVADGEGGIWVADAGNHRLQRLTITPKAVADLTGTVRGSIGHAGAALGEFWAPAHVAIDHAGRLYVADTGNARIQQLAPDGSVLAAWRGPDHARLVEPYGIAIAANALYVSDAAADRVLELTLNGAFVRMWGGSGEEPGRFRQPRGLTVDDGGFVYVADSGNHRVQKFDANGRFVAAVGCAGSAAGSFRHPSGVAIDGERHLYVADTGNHRIQKLGHQ